MDALILTNTYELEDIIDTYQSFIWTERYNGCGDFELYMPVSVHALLLMNDDRLIGVKDSNRVMMVENIEIKTDIEDGDCLIVTGRTLECILERRVIWGQKILSGNLQNGIEELLNENVIDPSNPARKIPGFEFRRSTDPAIVDLEVDTQFFGDNLYDAIFALCEVNGIGFRVLPKEGGGYIFELYNGTDRSFDQDEIPWVVFSPKYDNLLNSDYYESLKQYKNVSMVAGEDREEIPRKITQAIYEDTEPSGLDRREMYTDAGSISQTYYEEDSEGNRERRSLSDEDYFTQLRQKGIEELSEVSSTESFSGDVIQTNQFKYGTDFFIGDIVQVVNEYGLESVSRVSEVMRCHDVSGDTITPTFIAIQ